MHNSNLQAHSERTGLSKGPSILTIAIDCNDKKIFDKYVLGLDGELDHH